MTVAASRAVAELDAVEEVTRLQHGLDDEADALLERGALGIEARALGEEAGVGGLLGRR